MELGHFGNGTVGPLYDGLRNRAQRDFIVGDDWVRGAGKRASGKKSENQQDPHHQPSSNQNLGDFAPTDHFEKVYRLLQGIISAAAILAGTAERSTPGFNNCSCHLSQDSERESQTVNVGAFE